MLFNRTPAEVEDNLILYNIRFFCYDNKGRVCGLNKVVVCSFKQMNDATICCNTNGRNRS